MFAIRFPYLKYVWKHHRKFMLSVVEKCWNEICCQQVLSAKVVTNARSPGSKCYGLVTMSSSTEVGRCVSHLDCTELHGQQIYVERVSEEACQNCFQRDLDWSNATFFLIHGKIVGMCHSYFATAVLQAKNDPFKKEGSKKEAEDKASSSKSSDKRSSTGIKLTNK